MVVDQIVIIMLVTVVHVLVGVVIQMAGNLVTMLGVRIVAVSLNLKEEVNINIYTSITCITISSMISNRVISKTSCRCCCGISEQMRKCSI